MASCSFFFFFLAFRLQVAIDSKLQKIYPKTGIVVKN